MRVQAVKVRGARTQIRRLEEAYLFRTEDASQPADAATTRRNHERLDALFEPAFSKIDRIGDRALEATQSMTLSQAGHSSLFWPSVNVLLLPQLELVERDYEIAKECTWFGLRAAQQNIEEYFLWAFHVIQRTRIWYEQQGPGRLPRVPTPRRATKKNEEL